MKIHDEIGLPFAGHILGISSLAWSRYHRENSLDPNYYSVHSKAPRIDMTNAELRFEQKIISAAVHLQRGPLQIHHSRRMLLTISGNHD